MMSVDASGKFGGSMVFAKWKGRNYVRQLVTPKNPKAAKQTGVRSMLAFLAPLWTGLSAPNKATYDDLAIAKAISAFNAYVGENLARWQINKPPAKAYPAAELTSGCAITTAPLTGHENFVTAVVTPATNANIWGVIVYRDTATITAATWANAVDVIFCAGVTAFTWTDSPLEAGTYHYRFAQFNIDGVLGTVLADASITVPPA